jgi:hypothetical protein
VRGDWGGRKIAAFAKKGGQKKGGARGGTRGGTSDGSPAVELAKAQ